MTFDEILHLTAVVFNFINIISNLLCSPAPCVIYVVICAKGRHHHYPQYHYHRAAITRNYTNTKKNSNCCVIEDFLESPFRKLCYLLLRYFDRRVYTAPFIFAQILIEIIHVPVSNLEIVSNTKFFLFLFYQYRVELESDIDIQHTGIISNSNPISISDTINIPK